MTWNPISTVTVAGTDYTSQALIGATITYGRTNTYNQPRPGYAQITLADTTDSDLTIQIGSEVTFTVEDTSGTPITLFTGEVSDVVTSVVASSPIGTYLRRSITAIGPLMRLNRQLAGGSGYPTQLDGDRIAAILVEVYSTTWSEQPALQTWADTDPILTWATFDPYIGQVDQPGLFTLSAYSGGATLGVDVTTPAANSGLGVLYDTPGNRINYDDADHRQVNYLANGAWLIPVEAIISGGLSTSERLGDVANTIQLTYTGGEITVTDTTSIGLYGTTSQQITTILDNALDAADQADRYLGLVAYPTPQFDTLSLAVHAPDLPNATIDAALDVYQGEPVQINGLPNAIGPSFTGFVEGWTWRIGQKTCDLKLTVSDFARSIITTRWDGVTPALTWSTTNATLTWQEAILV